VGENTPTYINVRVLAATNEPLEKRIKEGTFREDLYYRLNVIAITLPSVRERPEDVPLLVSHFLRSKISPRNGQPVQITRQAMQVLNAHEWPGNVRELENAIERAATLCEDNIIQVADLPPSLVKKLGHHASPSDGDGEIAQLPEPATSIKNPFADPPAAGAAAPAAPAAAPAINTDLPLKDFLREQEVAYLNRIMAQMGGDKEKAALHLGISLATLYRKLSEDDRVG